LHRSVERDRPAIRHRGVAQGAITDWSNGDSSIEPGRALAEPGEPTRSQLCDVGLVGRENCFAEHGGFGAPARRIDEKLENLAVTIVVGADVG